VLGRSVLIQLRSHLLPTAPAIAGLAVGWWIANTYTDSHLRSVTRHRERRNPRGQLVCL
jgi:hypothetical protein